jgi:hypothetical protein
VLEDTSSSGSLLKIGELLELALILKLFVLQHSVFLEHYGYCDSGWKVQYLHWSTCQLKVCLEGVYHNAASAAHTLLHMYEGSVIVDITKCSVRTA